MTVIAADIEAQVSLLGPRFQLQFLHAFEALSAILAKYGLERVIAWANADGGDEARFVAALFKNTEITVKALTEYSEAMRVRQSGEDREGAQAARQTDRSEREGADRTLNKRRAALRRYQLSPLEPGTSRAVVRQQTS